MRHITLSVMFMLLLTAASAESKKDRYISEPPYNGISYSNTEDDKLDMDPTAIQYPFVEVKPLFEGEYLQRSFKEWVLENMKYPDFVKNKKFSGIICVEFTVTEEGNVKSPKLMMTRGLDSCLNEEEIQAITDEVIRTISVSPKWTPGIHKGKKKAVITMFPMKIEL